MNREEIREHLTELFEQTEGIKEPTNLAEAVLWVLNEDDVVIKIPVAPPIGGSAKMCCYEELI